MFPSSVMVEADLNVRNADGFKFQIGAAVVEFSKQENAYSITALPRKNALRLQETCIGKIVNSKWTRKSATT